MSFPLSSLKLVALSRVSAVSVCSSLLARISSTPCLELKLVSRIGVAFWTSHPGPYFALFRACISVLVCHLRFEIAFWSTSFCVLGAPLAIRLGFGVALLRNMDLRSRTCVLRFAF